MESLRVKCFDTLKLYTTQLGAYHEIQAFQRYS